MLPSGTSTLGVGVTTESPVAVAVMACGNVPFLVGILFPVAYASSAQAVAAMIVSLFFISIAKTFPGLVK
jgi:hypothetical protein